MSQILSTKDYTTCLNYMDLKCDRRARLGTGKRGSKWPIKCVRWRDRSDRRRLTSSRNLFTVIMTVSRAW
jgi:hypothetical protein